jgi:imidazolonepropionase
MEMTLAIKNAAQLVCVCRQRERVQQGSKMGELCVIPDGAVLVQDARITWVGPSADLPRDEDGVNVIDAAGKIVLPGLIDSHTHLVFAGTREEEFERRLKGASYQEISSSGGGIQSTVRHVRSASRDDLKTLARSRLKRLLRFGVTTVEVKSGYGLTLPDELKCLEVIADLNAEGPQELVPTFLGAHAVPEELATNRAAYVRQLTVEMLPEIALSGLAKFCDVFCDVGAFTLEESESILLRARELGFALKIHADELSALGGAELAARLGCTSADHLLCSTEAGIDALARAGTIASLLPGTAFFLGVPYAPARRPIDRGLAVALATDCNPGTCPTENLPLVGTMACTQMRMSPAEVVSALTINAAAALHLSDQVGSIEVGKQADIVIFDTPSYQQLFYHFGVNHVWRVIKRGRVVYAA